MRKRQSRAEKSRVYWLNRGVGRFELQEAVRRVDLAGPVENEEWRPYPKFEAFYEVSSLGRVRSLDRVTPRRVIRGRMRARNVDDLGYVCVTLSVGGSGSTRKVHRAVCEAWHGPAPEGLVCRHLDGDPLNSTPGNLAWGTVAENSQDQLRHGRHWGVAKTHCLRGHEFTPENTIRKPAGRSCRECDRVRKRAAA